MSVSINRFFTETLGANLKNPRWSWGAVDPMHNRVFLRVWSDEISGTSDGERVLVSIDEPRIKSNGVSERQAHIQQIAAGAEGLGVVCEAADPSTRGARKIVAFDRDTLLRLGEFTKENGRTFAKILGRVDAVEHLHRQTAQSTLTEDLRAISRLKVHSTTKEALINARVGQGVFRSQVLELWGRSCAVTGASTLDGIRASHIKPWRLSTSDERLDPYNGLPLIANLDALFDAGLVSFAATGELLISTRLSPSERVAFSLNDRGLLRPLPEATLNYLEYHRDKVFAK